MSAIIIIMVSLNDEGGGEKYEASSALIEFLIRLQQEQNLPS